MVFCNSIASGVLITGGLFVGDPWLGTCSAISLVSATAMARLASGASPTRANAAARFGAEQHSVRRAAAVDDDMVSNGLASYNGALVGCAVIASTKLAFAVRSFAATTQRTSSSVADARTRQTPTGAERDETPNCEKYTIRGDGMHAAWVVFRLV